MEKIDKGNGLFELDRKQDVAGNDVVMMEVPRQIDDFGGRYISKQSHFCVAQIERGSEYTAPDAGNVKHFMTYKFTGDNYKSQMNEAKKDFEAITGPKAKQEVSFMFEKGDNENER